MNRVGTLEGILELGYAFRGAKALMSAVELGVFTALAEGPLDGGALRQRLGLAERGARDFFDALVLSACSVATAPVDTPTRPVPISTSTLARKAMSAVCSRTSMLASTGCGVP